MRSEKGITLISLIVYIISLTIVMAIISTLTSFFTNNVVFASRTGKDAVQYTKFNMFFLEEVKENNNKISEVGENFISFSNGNTYTFENNKIYKNKIKICNGIADISFIQSRENNTLEILLTFSEDLINPIRTLYSVKYL